MGSLDLGVVGGYDIIWQEEEGSSRVCDGGDALSHSAGSADGVAACCETPESLAVVDGGVGDVACIFSVVDVAEVVGAWLSFLQVGGEEGGVEKGFCVCEESLLLIWGDGVDATECETEEAVGFIGCEF